jgi:hypothetical protein
MAKAASSCDGTTVLRLLVDQGPQSLDAICRHVLGKPAPIGSQARRNVRAVIGRLIGGGLVERQGRANGSLRNQDVAIFAAARAGHAFVASGKTITSGPRGAMTGVPKKDAGMRQRLWEVLRRKQKATLADLVELARRDGDPDPVKVIDNARKYMRGLARAGIVKKLASRVPGFSPTSNGFNRYVLLLDLGPRAPLTGKRFVTNPNAPDTEARIAYRERP